MKFNFNHLKRNYLTTGPNYCKVQNVLLQEEVFGRIQGVGVLTTVAVEEQRPTGSHFVKSVDYRLVLLVVKTKNYETQ